MRSIFIKQFRIYCILRWSFVALGPNSNQPSILHHRILIPISEWVNSCSLRISVISWFGLLLRLVIFHFFDGYINVMILRYTLWKFSEFKIKRRIVEGLLFWVAFTVVAFYYWVFQSITVNYIITRFDQLLWSVINTSHILNWIHLRWTIIYTHIDNLLLLVVMVFHSLVFISNIAASIIDLNNQMWL